MHLSFILAVVAALRLTVSMPVAEHQCSFTVCSLGRHCCPGFTDVVVSSGHTCVYIFR
ncbi:hypothetical protein BDR03DRAFT_953102 [Suillus americanus]|nr:hypothetical protein BDR03DRAFT_953102 [Suillus americanus]